MRKILGVLVASVLVPAALSACQGDTPAGGAGATNSAADYPPGGGVNSDRAARFELDHTGASPRGGGPQYQSPPQVADNSHPAAAPAMGNDVARQEADRNARGAPAGATPGNTNSAGIRPPATTTDWGDPQVAAALSAVDMVEVKEGNLAVRMARSPAVRQFGRMMVQHHTADEASARRLLGRVHIDPAPNTTTDHILADADQAMNRMAGLQGDAFDRAYIDNAVQDHQIVLNLIDQHLLPSVRQPELRAMIQGTVRPMVQSHLEHAQRIQSALMAHTGAYPGAHTGSETGSQGQTPAQAQQRP